MQEGVGGRRKCARSLSVPATGSFGVPATSDAEKELPWNSAGM